MPLDGFTGCSGDADARAEPVAVAVAGGDDPTVLEALRIAAERGWVGPILVGPESAIRAMAESKGIELRRLHDRPGRGRGDRRGGGGRGPAGEARALDEGADRHARAAAGRARPRGRAADRPGRLPGRADGRPPATAAGSCWPTRASASSRTWPGGSTSSAVRSRSRTPWVSARPRVALMAATEKVKPAMPETVEAAELQRRNRQGEFPGCSIQGPLSFDLAYAADAGAKKRIGGAVVGAADVMVFPNLLSANLTVKAIMYTADCRFGGVLRGTAAPVVFMSRADTPDHAAQLAGAGPAAPLPC